MVLLQYVATVLCRPAKSATTAIQLIRTPVPIPIPLAVYGDSIVGPGEECDDGNANNTDACLDTCVDASCGDTFVQSGIEACDDGNNVNGDGCQGNCQLPGCGDGMLDPGEECDDGNLIAVQNRTDIKFLC